MCLSVCFFDPYARPQFLADLDQIWRVASLSSSSFIITQHIKYNTTLKIHWYNECKDKKNTQTHMHTHME